MEGAKGGGVAASPLDPVMVGIEPTISPRHEGPAMVILDADQGYQVIANNGFVWIEFEDGRECVFSDDEADQAWAEFELREGERKASQNGETSAS